MTSNDDLDDIATLLNRDHADSLLVIGRGLISAETSSAELVEVTYDHCRLLVVCNGLTNEHRLDFSDAQSTLDGVRGELFELVRSARRSSPGLGHTALEKIVADAERLDEREARVVARCDLSPGLVELTFAGLDEHQDLGGDEYVRLSAHGTSAFFTVRRRRCLRGEVDVWFVVGTGGAWSTWAAQAMVGERVLISAPRATFDPNTDANHILALVDASGLAASARILEEAASASAVSVVASVDEPTATAIFGAERSSRVRVVDPRRRYGLLNALEEYGELSVDEHRTVVFGAGESSEMRAIREHLRVHHHLARERYSVHGYWRHRY